MKRLFFLPFIIFLLGSCATNAQRGGDTFTPPSSPDEQISPLQQELIDSARWALGKNALKVKDRQFNMDCTGVILAIYYRSGIDLSRDFNRYGEEASAGCMPIWMIWTFYTEPTIPGRGTCFSGTIPTTRTKMAGSTMN